jgi:hypothetical protein
VLLHRDDLGVLLWHVRAPAAFAFAGLFGGIAAWGPLSGGSTTGREGGGG